MVYINDEIVSKKELNRISKRIVENTDTIEDLQKLSDFRAEHSKIIKSFVWSLRSIINNKKIKLSNRNRIIISQRLKRLPSIIGKLKRFPELRLSRMQDLAGARIILPNIKDTEEVANYLKNKVYKQKDKNNFLFVREKNYILEPKEDGYRSIHQIFKYQGKKESQLEGYQIELQIRTRLQHQWATSVEIIDSIKQQSLKTGGGDAYYREFFKLSSKLMEYIEFKKDMNEISDKIKRLNDLDKEFNILKTLSSLRVVTKELEGIKSKEYLILILDYKGNTVRYIPVFEENISRDYLMYEQEYKGENNNVVSVSVENLKNLKKAYPNYFLDAREFVTTIEKYINTEI
nr:RelA/SpoT domain-containing protein [uncultured Leptotrichia sp.]